MPRRSERGIGEVACNEVGRRLGVMTRSVLGRLLAQPTSA
jgi:hypothetical protein